MTSYTRRLIEDSPSMNLALVTFVQAISLEKLTDRAIALSAHSGDEVLLCYLAGSAILVGIVIMWLTYSQMFCLLDWIPHPTQPFVGFGIGLLQFASISLLRPETLSVALAFAAILFIFGGSALAHGFGYFQGSSENKRIISGFSRWRPAALLLGAGVLQALAALLVSTMLALPLMLLVVGTNLVLISSWSVAWWRLVRDEQAVASAV